MADIILKNQNGNDAIFEGVDSVSFRAVGGGKATFTSGGGGVTSWNDLTDKPFEEKIEYTDTLTWDGNFEAFEGYKIALGEGATAAALVHVSDSVPLITDIDNNWIVEITNSETGEAEQLADVIFHEPENGSIIGTGSSAYIVIIPTDNFVFDDTLTFAKKGVYLSRYAVESYPGNIIYYCSKFSLLNYSFAVTIIKKIDEKFLPTKSAEPVKELIMYSSTEGSDRKFKITVDDTGMIIATRLFEYEEIRVPSSFDNTGDGIPEVYWFSPTLHSSFSAADAIQIDAVKDITDNNGVHQEAGSHYIKYDEAAAGIGTLPPHVYCYDNSTTNYLRYSFYVDKPGLYELAAHLRIKDEQLRGATYTINKGTEYEHAFVTTYGWDSLEEALAVRNGDELQGSYMRGMFVHLQAGMNTIHITIANGVTKNQHFRNLYLAYVEGPSIEVPETLTMDEAQEIGIGLAKGAILPEYYDITVTFNNGAPRASDGFCRVSTSNGNKMSIQKITLADGQTMPVEGDTIILRGKIGCVNSTVNGDIGKEARIFNAILL